MRTFTNKPPCGPKRGHGTPQPRFALEVQLDKAAERLGLDPAEIRLAHLQPPDSVTANWLKIGSMGLGACIEAVVEASGWKEKHGKLPRGRGVGLACSSYISGAGLPIYWNAMPHSGVTVQLDRGGGVAVFCGATDIGQGSDTVLATCVAEVLGVDLHDIRLKVSDTDFTPVDLGSYSSRVTLMAGNAAIQAAERVREVLAKAVAAEWRGLRPPASPSPTARCSTSRIPSAACPSPRRWSWRSRGSAPSRPRGRTRPPPRRGATGARASAPPRPTRTRPPSSRSRSTRRPDVSTSTKIWVAHDVGQCINRKLVIGQVEGGVYMGLGEALMEDMAYRANRFGVHKIPSMLEYKSPTTLEMPEVETIIVEDPDPNGPFGAKEVGQGPLLPMPPGRGERRVRRPGRPGGRGAGHARRRCSGPSPLRTAATVRGASRTSGSWT